jgi:hypothetical protein
MTKKNAQSDQIGVSGTRARFAGLLALGLRTVNASMRRGLTMTNSYNLLRDALSWFTSHEVEKKLGHLPQWVVMGRELLPDCLARPIDSYTTEERTHISDRRDKMDELISKTALLAHFRKERDEYLRVHFKQDPATGCWEGNTPEEEYLGDLEERIDFIEQFPAVEPIGKLVNNNQPGWVNLIETAPSVTIDVGTPVYVAPSPS